MVSGREGSLLKGTSGGEILSNLVSGPFRSCLSLFSCAPLSVLRCSCAVSAGFIFDGQQCHVYGQAGKSETYSTFSSYSLTIIPMFLLMGQFATASGMSSALFRAAESWLGHRRGGVAMATVGACAGFGAICGSSLATAATMGKVALPELRRYGYSGGFLNRHAGRWRYSWHSDPAVGYIGDLCHSDRAEYSQAVRGGVCSRTIGGCRVYAHDIALCPPSS